jgi:diguanylate cyclase (GGDEF)-like protein
MPGSNGEGAAPDGAVALDRDPVTGAYTRAALDRHLATLAASGDAYVICLFDVDYFKSVNDAYGHARGDLVLAQVAERVRSSVRDGDLLFRYGGDEFVLVITASSADGALATGSRAVSAVREESFGGDPPLHVTISMGVATSMDAADPAEVLEVADRRNYDAKRAGRDRVVGADGVVAAVAAWPHTRLVERDDALDAVHRVVETVARGRPAVLRVRGERGTGRTRLLEEAGAAARMRGLPVVHVRAEEGVPSLPAKGLLLVDVGAGAADVLSTLLAGLGAAAAGGPHTYGVVLADGAGAPAVPDGVVVEEVETRPLTARGLAVWLRMLLRDEAPGWLIERVVERTGGHPALVLAELTDLAATGRLVAAGPGSAQRPPVRLPQPLTALVDRERETGDVSALLRVHRLVTLLGPGGIGKTRLSIAAARVYAEQSSYAATFVPLDDARTSTDVCRSIMTALEVPEEIGAAPLTSLTRHLRDRDLLLVLDNFEQAVDASPVLSDLLAAAPGLRLLVTSRERLRVYGERVYRVSTLDVGRPGEPEPGEQGKRSAAVELFLLRAADTGAQLDAVEAAVDTVAELCRRLDGLPLAIELAAARTDEHAPAELLAQLDDRLELLSDGPRDLPARQRTLRGAIDWSVDLLSGRERRVLARLGVFVGGWTDDAAAAVCADPDLEPVDAVSGGDVVRMLLRLRDASLVHRVDDADIDGPGRWAMYESIRAYAQELLERGDQLGVARAAHAAWAMSLTAEAESKFWTADYVGQVARLEAEMPNLRAALAWSLEHDPRTAATLADKLWIFWSGHGHVGEARDWLERTLAASGSGVPPELLCGVRDGAGVIATLQGDVGAALAHLEAGLALCAACDEPSPRRLASLHSNLARVLDTRGDYAGAREHHERGLALRRAVDDVRGVAASIGNLGDTLRRLGELDRARELTLESLAVNRRIGNVVNATIALANLAETEVLAGNAGAWTTCEQALAAARDLGDPDLEAQVLHCLGMLSADAGQPDAAALFARALKLRADLGELDAVAMTLEELARLATLPTDRDPTPSAARRAAVLYGAAEALRMRSATPLPPVLVERHAFAAERARAALDPVGYASARADGAALPLDRLLLEVASGT